MLAERQKIVVVDDNFDEIKPFLTALWKMKLPFVYLDGQLENIPKEPFIGVRIIFLDIVLGTEGTSNKNKAAPVANVVKHIIGNNKNPYFIIFWTKHPEIKDDVLRYLELENISPVGHLCHTKPSGDNVTEETSDVIEKIDSEIKNLEAFDFLLAWENITEKTTIDFSTNIFSIIPAKGNQSEWSKQVTTLMGSLAKAYTEQDSLSNTEEDVRNAFIMMTDSFKDSLQQTVKSTELTFNTALSNENLELEQTAKINTSLFFDFKPNKMPSFGNVFIISDSTQHLYDALIKNIFDNTNSIPENTSIAGIIITPACDLANNKHLHNGKECFRILYGLLIPIEDNKNPRKNLKLSKMKSEALFDLAPFWYNINDKPHLLVFHFGSLSSEWWKKEEIPEFVFSIKEHLAFDIQSKMANHANRLGNSMLNFR